MDLNKTKEPMGALPVLPLHVTVLPIWCPPLGLTCVPVPWSLPGPRSVPPSEPWNGGPVPHTHRAQ